jgi:hypothetical protein
MSMFAKPAYVHEELKVIYFITTLPKKHYGAIISAHAADYKTLISPAIYGIIYKGSRSNPVSPSL